MHANLLRPALLALVTSLLLAACSDSNPASPTILPGAPYSQTDLIVGTGAAAVSGSRASVFYTLWIYDPSKTENKGTQVQTNVGATPLTFTVGAGAVIPGFDRGVQGMQVGGRRRVIIPPDLAYGSTGSSDGGIPPYATLVFDVDLAGIQ
jgi:FKBP-type peptidyl-prolyl cis-trans isomerase FkpA